MLLGRAAEVDELQRLVAGLADDAGFSLVLQGGPGIGKTVLLDELAARCGDGVTVLRAAGTQRESELVFAGLGELVAPLMGLLDELPERQRGALRSALALGDVTPHSDLEVFVAATSLFARAAGDQPLLCLVDDAHWVDAASIDAVLFVAKRMAGRLGFVFATREDLVSRLDTTTIPRLTLRPLDADSARRLVMTANPALLSSRVDDVVVAAEGYPLALIEFAQHIAVPAGHAETPLPVGERVQRVFSEQARALATPVRTALVVLAASEQSTASVVTAAVEQLTGSATALDAAIDSGLVRRQGDRYVFRHPLARSAAYQAATQAEQRAAHLALAKVLGEAQPEVAAWHRGLSCVAPDESVARALEETALSARSRGGRLAESRALELAARLSPDPDRATLRLLTAGGAALQAGRHARARVLLTEVVARSTDIRVLADAQHLLAQIAFWQDGRVPGDLLTVADRVEPADRERAARLLSFALVPMISDCRVEEALPIARRAWALVGNGVRPFEVAFRVAHVLVMAGEPDAVTLTGDAAAAAEDAADLAAMIMISQPLWWLERYGDADRLLEHAVTKARASDSLWMLCHGLINQAELARRTGALRRAHAAASEALGLAETLGDPMQRAEALAQLAAAEAQEGEGLQAVAHAGQALRIVEARSAGATELRLTAGQALARVALTAGRPLDAVEHLQPLVQRVIANGLGDPALIPCVTDLLDAQRAAGRFADALDLESWLAGAGERVGRRWAKLATVRARAQRVPGSEEELARALADDAGADALLTAQAWLTYGELVRRGGERARAREALTRADRAFRVAGARAWYERVAAELRACGESVGQPSSARSVPNSLTPQEERIARMAGAGARNREIARTLSLSEKTVETHLAAAFRKLGVRSRTELAARFVARP